ncbi:tRNA (guanosine(37)-N1)-methyltransferase TrmD [Ruminococcus flavefaciens]|uniref:tRNA (guanosine(37)-N1)-methyltransferase TrmD n=1 Tax=Ruminococcus flavefaciens TaxID=1265 RepID=UPI0026F35EF4|nr:tRNA (guanosine(37)-N1)-methyltransferase TrmD [Ruminococcus flavefaciens]MDD7517634.1 tRNA (guanosine(37)-N1)-methyltransferase TrmD [Ruminococcus flavefaciens]MDY5691324.1 tRNA (guanosine(37)-N1)-methyltransferase TrmD [Ruminococcus flavefaciens]
MHIEIATLFPEMCEAVLGESIIGRARKAEKLSLHCRQIREYTQDKHHRVDDTPYGGGMGMVMQCEPIYNCYKAVCEELGEKPHTIYMSPKGSVFTQEKAIELSKMNNILIICGHYEGVDQRVIDKIVDEEISIGDYVLTGGEIPAMVVADAVARMCDGVLSDEVCFTDESIYSGLLEYPQYTRPEVWEGEAVPPVLLTGHHKNIETWRHEQSLKITAERRPDLLAKYNAQND